MDATIVRAWQDDKYAYMALAVDEGEVDENGQPKTVEYIGTIPIELYNELDAKTQRAVLIGACKTMRTAQQSKSQDLAHSGKVKL